MFMEVKIFKHQRNICAQLLKPIRCELSPDITDNQRWRTSSLTSFEAMELKVTALFLDGDKKIKS